MTVYNFDRLPEAVRLKHNHMKKILNGFYTYHDVDQCCNWYWTQSQFGLDGLRDWSILCSRESIDLWGTKLVTKVPNNIRDFFQQYIDFVEPPIIDLDEDDEDCI